MILSVHGISSFQLGHPLKWVEKNPYENGSESVPASSQTQLMGSKLAMAASPDIAVGLVRLDNGRQRTALNASFHTVLDMAEFTMP